MYDNKSTLIIQIRHNSVLYGICRWVPLSNEWKTWDKEAKGNNFEQKWGGDESHFYNINQCDARSQSFVFSAWFLRISAKSISEHFLHFQNQFIYSRSFYHKRNGYWHHFKRISFVSTFARIYLNRSRNKHLDQ